MENLSIEQNENGWKNETEQRGESVQNFLIEYFREESSIGRTTEGLEFSGGSMRLMGNVQKGKVFPKEVNVLYNDGVETQVHAVFATERNEQNLDVYFTKHMLEQFLENKK